jgi:hypothetical protein
MRYIKGLSFRIIKGTQNLINNAQLESTLPKEIGAKMRQNFLIGPFSNTAVQEVSRPKILQTQTGRMLQN